MTAEGVRAGLLAAVARGRPVLPVEVGSAAGQVALSSLEEQCTFAPCCLGAMTRHSLFPTAGAPGARPPRAAAPVLARWGRGRPALPRCLALCALQGSAQTLSPP